MFSKNHLASYFRLYLKGPLPTGFVFSFEISSLNYMTDMNNFQYRGCDQKDWFLCYQKIISLPTKQSNQDQRSNNNMKKIKKKWQILNDKLKFQQVHPEFCQNRDEAQVSEVFF